MKKDFILASQSPQRRRLLMQIGFEPAKIEAADIDETPQKGEKPSAYVKRMAWEKALHVAEKYPGEIVLGGDAVIVVNSKIIQKAHSDEEQEKVMKMLSGKTHKVLSAVCVINREGRKALRLSTTKMSDKEIEDYVNSKEWIGAAGYKIEGCLAGLVRKISGSYSGVVGLPLYEARNMLISAGVK